MNKKFILLLLMLPFIYHCVSAQRRDTLLYYFDAKLQRVKHRADATYGGLMIKEYPDHWTLYIFYPDRKVMFIGNYDDKKMQVRDGVFVTFSENGNKNMYATFRQNIFNGPNESWYENGQIKDSGSYDNGFKNGKWKTWYDGGQLESVGSYVDGHLEGQWLWFRENGQLATKETYLDDSLKNLSCYNEERKPDGISCGIDIPPSFPGGPDSLNAFIVNNLYYPDEAVKEHIEGNVSFGFWVKKNGSIGDIEIESSPSALLSNEVIRMLKSMPAWLPAISHNRKVDYYEKMTIPFYLNE